MLHANILLKIVAWNLERSKKTEDKSFIDYDILCNEMIPSELLSDVNKAILRQSIQAMNIGFMKNKE